MVIDAFCFEKKFWKFFKDKSCNLHEKSLIKESLTVSNKSQKTK